MVFMRRRGQIDSGTYKIRLYRYGKLWKTIKVAKGSSIKVGTCDTAYSDDTFYGWSTAYNSVTRTYTSSNSIKPTADLNLYAIFSYSVSSTVLQSTTASVTIGTTATTLTIDDAVAGQAYNIYTKETTFEQGSSLMGDGATTVYFVKGTNTRTNITSGTATSANISYNFGSYSPRTYSITVGQSNLANNSTAHPTSSKIGYIQYYKRFAQTGTKYRVVSHDNPSVINVYRYGVLYKTLSIQEGLSITVGSCAAAYADDTFVGYSIDPTSTTQTYTATSAIAPHGTLDLYAVYSYKDSAVSYTTLSTGGQYGDQSEVSVTLECAGTLTINGVEHYSSQAGDGGETAYVALSSTNNSYYAKIGSTYITGTTPITRSVSAGNVITLKGYYTSGNAWNRTWSLTAQYPYHQTLYRVSSHEGG